MTFKRLIFWMSCFCIATHAAALDEKYHFSLELKPVSSLVTPLKNGRGVTIGSELGPVSNTFFVIEAGRSFADYHSDTAINTALGAGLRHYSYYRTDSLYLSWIASDSQTKYSKNFDDSTWLMHSVLEMQWAVGYRWLWQSGVMLRTGIEATRRLRETGQEPPRNLSLQEAERSDQVIKGSIRNLRRAVTVGADLGVGVIF